MDLSHGQLQANRRAPSYRLNRVTCSDDGSRRTVQPLTMRPRGTA